MPDGIMMSICQNTIVSGLGRSSCQVSSTGAAVKAPLCGESCWESVVSAALLEVEFLI